MDHRERAGLQAAIAAFTTWGLLTVYWKQLDDFEALELIAWRVASAALIMCLAVSAMQRWTPVLAAFRDQRTRLRLVAAGALLTVNWTAYVWAVTNDRVLETALGYFLALLGTMAIGVFVLGEQLTPFRRASIVFAAAAVVILTVSYGRLPWVALLIAASWSTYGLIKRRVALAPAESLAAELLVLLAPALVAIVIASSGVGWPGDTAVWAQAGGVDWLLVLGTGAITAFPLTLFAFAAQRVPFTLLGPTNYLVPLINFLLGWVVYDEPLPWVRAVGFGLIWFALGLVTFETVHRHRREVRVRRQPAATTWG